MTHLPTVVDPKRQAAIAAIDQRLDRELKGRLGQSFVARLAVEPGAPKVRRWASKDGALERIYFLGDLGYLTVTRSGVTDIERGKETLRTSALFPAQRRALARARKAFLEDAADWASIYADKRAAAVSLLDAGHAAGRDPGKAPSVEGLAVYLKKDTEGRKVFGVTATLYQAAPFVEELRRVVAAGDSREAAVYAALESAIVGVVEVGEIDEDNGRCHGAWEVKRVAGPRYAEVLYGIGFGLTPTGLLAPDRNNVSKAAARVWERQAQMGRKRVAFEPFSSAGKGACLRYRAKNPGLDFAFEAEGWEKALVRRLSTEGLLAMSRAKTISRATDRDIADVVAEVSWTFWESHRPKAEREAGLYFVSSNFED